MIIAEIKDNVDDITVDTMGNVIAYKGSDSGKKIAVTVNMDERFYHKRSNRKRVI